MVSRMPKFSLMMVFRARPSTVTGSKSMLDFIEQDMVSTVIVKDMSRFGRNYLEVGQLTEIVFLQHNVRLIAIADGVDSDKGEDDFIAFRNVINEFYLKDLSRKLRSSLRIKSKQGFSLGHPPLGYKRDPDEPKRWVIDEESAEIVRHIFDLRLRGTSINDIAKMLRHAKILTPMAYASKKVIRTLPLKTSVMNVYGKQIRFVKSSESSLFRRCYQIPYLFKILQTESMIKQRTGKLGNPRGRT